MRWSWAFPVLLGAVALLNRPVSSFARPDATLWVLQPPCEVVAFDAADFSRVGGVRIPPTAFNDPERLSINGVGQMLVRLDSDRLWLWDGETARKLPTHPDFPYSADSSPGATPAIRQWLLGDDGSSLYVLQREPRRQESAVDTATMYLFVRATSLSQRPRDEIFSSAGKPCQLLDEGGVEPCPKPRIWVPGGVVRDYFVLTHWEQESYGDPSDEALPSASFHRTLFRRPAKGWQTSSLGIWGEEPPLDAGGNGSIWVQAVGDDGCCGAENGSSDRTSITNSDTSVILFDEWSRFHNQDYDVSFFTANARVAPGGTRVAYTVHATAGAAEELPLSVDGHPDSLELASIRRSLAELPLVEVHGMRPLPVLLRRLAQSELIGWLSDSEVLVVEDHRLIAVDVVTGRTRNSGIGVRSAKDAFVVRR